MVDDEGDFPKYPYTPRKQLIQAGMAEIPGVTFGQQQYAASELHKQAMRAQADLNAQVGFRFFFWCVRACLGGF